MYRSICACYSISKVVQLLSNAISNVYLSIVYCLLLLLLYMLLLLLLYMLLLLLLLCCL